MILAESGMGNLIIPVRILTIVVEIIWLIHIISKFRIGSRVIHLSAIHQSLLYQCRVFITGQHLNTFRLINHRSFERIGNTGFAYRSPFGGNEQYTVGGFRSVKSGSSRVFQDSYLLDIVR